jgi:hypothetical protein
LEETLRLCAALDIDVCEDDCGTFLCEGQSRCPPNA